MQLQAVMDDWYFQMYYDDLPVWGFIGKMEKIIKQGVSEFKYYLFTHIDFDIKYNEDRVIEINVSTDPQQAVDISETISGDVKVKFTYTVKWQHTTITFDKRLQRYERFPLNPVHLEVIHAAGIDHAWGMHSFANHDPCDCRSTGFPLSTLA